jgi:hypothetical protein
MNRAEKLRLSADTEYCHCFKQGIFARFYEQAPYWFISSVKPLKPMLETVKSGEPVLYGGLPITSFEKLLEEGALLQAEGAVVIEPLVRMGNTLAAHRYGILNWYDHPISSGPMEGTNNKIKVMKRMAYGYRDMEFFKLRILAIHEAKYALAG